MTTVTIIADNGIKYTIQLHNTVPVLAQLRTYISCNTTERVDTLAFLVDGGEILPSDTISSLHITNGDLIDMLHIHTKNTASPKLVQHLQTGGFNPNVCKYYSGNIAVYKL